MERLKRYNKQIVAFVSAFVVLVGGVLSTSFQSRAGVGWTYYSSYAEPTCDDYSGYIVLHQDDGDFVYFWTISPISASENSTWMSLTINHTSVGFTASSDGNAFLSLWRLNEYSVRVERIYQSSFSSSVSTSAGIMTPHAYSYYGNVDTVSDNVHGTSHPGVAVVWAEENLTYKKIVDIYNSILTLQSNTSVTNSKLDSMITQLNNLLSEIDNVEESLDSMYSIMSKYYDSFDEDLQNIYNRLGEMVEEQKKTNTWLEKIWNSIQEFFNPSEGEKTESEQFESETTEKSDEIGGLVEESKTEKPDVDDMSNSIDSNLDMTSANEYGAVLLNITENEYILQMLLIVVTVAIIAYVLFGKR